MKYAEIYHLAMAQMHYANANSLDLSKTWNSVKFPLKKSILNKIKAVFHSIIGCIFSKGPMIFAPTGTDYCGAALCRFMMLKTGFSKKIQFSNSQIFVTSSEGEGIFYLAPTPNPIAIPYQLCRQLGF